MPQIMEPDIFFDSVNLQQGLPMIVNCAAAQMAARFIGENKIVFVAESFPVFQLVLCLLCLLFLQSIENELGRGNNALLAVF